MVRIFLAHASEDKDAVTRLYHRLKEKGYQPWLDKEDLLPGQKWQKAISKAIKESDIFIACLSQRSISKSGYVQNEWRMALKEYASRPADSIFLIPLRLDDCHIPDLRQEEYGVNLRDFHWGNLFETDGFERLLNTLSQATVGTSQPKKTNQVEVIRSLETVSFQRTIIPPGGKMIIHTQKTVQCIREDLGNGIILEMVQIPGGTFLMGAPWDDPKRLYNEGPQHKVKVPAFLMGRYPVTQDQWSAITALPKIEHDLNPDPSFEKGGPLPVDQVSWLDAVEFCQRLSDHTGREYRLPSEAEWEYACRAGTTTPYFFGEELRPPMANFDMSKGVLTDVGSYPANDFGLHDMHGNVWEWCQDHWHDNYKGAPADGSAWLTDDESALYVTRGGSVSDVPGDCRSAYRDNNYPDNRNNFIGFRVSCSAARALK